MEVPGHLEHFPEHFASLRCHDLCCHADVLVRCDADVLSCWRAGMGHSDMLKGSRCRTACGQAPEERIPEQSCRLLLAVVLLCLHMWAQCRRVALLAYSHGTMKRLVLLKLPGKDMALVGELAMVPLPCRRISTPSLRPKIKGEEQQQHLGYGRGFLPHRVLGVELGGLVATVVWILIQKEIMLLM